MQCKYNYNFVTWHGDGWGNSTVKVVNMNIKKKKKGRNWLKPEPNAKRCFTRHLLWKKFVKVPGKWLFFKIKLQVALLLQDANLDGDQYAF